MRLFSIAVLALAAFLLPASDLMAQAGTQASAAIQSALRNRDFQHAVELSRAALQQSPRDPKLWTLQGIAFTGMGKSREALAAYDKALAAAPDYLAALEGAAELEYKVGSPRAAALLERILKLRPDDPTTHAMLGVLSYKQHDCATASKHFRASGSVISAQPAALAEYGSCLMELQEAESAVPVFEQLLAAQPGDSHARYNLTVVQFTAHQSKQAIETLQPLLAAPTPDPDVLDLASSVYEDTGDTPRAVELLRQAIVANPKKVRYYLDFATLSFNHGSFQVGIDMVDVGIKQMPQAAALYVARGILYIQAGKVEEGEADFHTANKIDPRQTSGAIAEGMAQIQQSNLDQALTTVNAQLASHPRDAYLHYLKAQIIMQKGPEVESAQFKEAIAAAVRAEQLDPDFGLPRDILGNLYLKSGQLNLAIQQCRLALRDNPSDQEALYHLIQALRQSGKGSKEELASMVKRLAELRAESRKQEASGNRYKLNESGTPAPE